MAGTDDIAKTAEGDPTAFQRVVEAHQARVFALFGRMGLDAASAEDVAQETFLRVWKNASRYNSVLSAPATWILTIARNAALTTLESRAHRREVGEDFAPEDAATDPAADEVLIAAERRLRLRRALQGVSPKDRALLAASYFDELSLADIAEIEGCTPGAAKLRLHRARARLREILEADDE